MLGVSVVRKCVGGSRPGSGSSPVKKSASSRRPSNPSGRAFPLRRSPCFLLLVAVLSAGVADARSDPTVEELKARVSSATVNDKAKICLEIAEKQLNTADKLFTTDEFEKAQSSLTDVVSYSELARDYCIQSHKHQKQTEIAIRSMTRKLNDLLHVIGLEEQGPVRDAINRLERARDDLLAAMFPKGVK